MLKRVLILSASAKNNGLCVAGLDVDGKKLIRLVSADQETDYAIPKSYMKDVQIGDIVNVHILRAAPNEYQPENYLADVHERPSVQQHCDDASIVNQMRNHLYQGLFLFGNTHKILNTEEMMQNKRSLAWIKASDVSVYENQYGKTWTSFCYRGYRYQNISVTDQRFFDLHGDRIEYHDAYFLMSLPHKPWQSPDGDDLYFKFVAMILSLDKEVPISFDVPF